jgi:hypothetical protein
MNEFAIVNAATKGHHINLGRRRLASALGKMFVTMRAPLKSTFNVEPLITTVVPEILWPAGI